MADTHNPDEYTHAMDIYNRIAGIGSEAKAEAESYIGGLKPNTPPSEMEAGLEGILKKHAPSQFSPESHSKHITSSYVNTLATAAALISVLYFIL